MIPIDEAARAPDEVYEAAPSDERGFFCRMWTGGVRQCGVTDVDQRENDGVSADFELVLNGGRGTVARSFSCRH
jgi:hypothetical protein